MLLNITIELWQKGKWYVAKSPELDFVSQGKTGEEAKKNLIEVINIQFHEMEEMGTLHEITHALKSTGSLDSLLNYIMQAHPKYM